MSHECSILVTAETHQYLQERCADLRSKLDKDRKELATLVSEEKDSTGNHPLMEAQRQLAILEGQLVEAETTLANTVLAPLPPCNIVAIGSKVLIKMCKCGNSDRVEELELVIDGCDCGRPGVQVVTPQAPFGAAIIGAEVGDECECKTPKGVVQITIVSISRA